MIEDQILDVEGTVIFGGSTLEVVKKLNSRTETDRIAVYVRRGKDGRVMAVGDYLNHSAKSSERRQGVKSIYHRALDVEQNTLFFGPDTEVLTFLFNQTPRDVPAVYVEQESSGNVLPVSEFIDRAQASISARGIAQKSKRDEVLALMNEAFSIETELCDKSLEEFAVEFTDKIVALYEGEKP